jgi:general secretion pathway protein C
LKNPESNIQDLYTLDTLLAYNTAEITDDELASCIRQEQETVTTLPAEQSSNDTDTAKTLSDQSIEKTSDTKITDTPAEQVLTRIRTKIKYVETILKKAVIEPYHINGQIEGLQINGLDKILVAKDLLLKSGDIIRTVNGHSLNSKKRAYEVFKKARKLPIMEIELLRDGKSRTLLYYLK